MASRQSYIVRGMKKHPLSVGAGIRQQASQLPAMYAMRQNKEYQDAQIGLGEQKLALDKKAQTMQAKQFEKGMDMEREAQDTAKTGMMLQGGLAIGKGMHSEGMFNAGIAKVKGLFGSTSQQKATGTAGYGAGQADNPTLQGGPSQQTPSSWDQFTTGGWKSGLWGGLSGGAVGAGAAKMFGAKKKWQVAAAGAAGGVAGSWMSGASLSDPFSLALGGALGGGLGFLLG